MIRLNLKIFELEKWNFYAGRGMLFRPGFLCEPKPKRMGFSSAIKLKEMVGTMSPYPNARPRIKKTLDTHTLDSGYIFSANKEWFTFFSLWPTVGSGIDPFKICAVRDPLKSVTTSHFQRRNKKSREQKIT